MKTKWWVGLVVALLCVPALFAQEGDAVGAANVNGAKLLVWDDEGVATLVNTATNEVLVTLEHGESLIGAAWNPLGNRVFTYSANKQIVWNEANGNQLLSTDYEGVLGAEWIGDSRLLLWTESSILLIDAQGGDVYLEQAVENLAGLSVSGDESTAVWWSSDGTISAVSLSGEVAAVATEAPTTSTGELRASDITPGLWRVTWGETLSDCTGGGSSANRDFLMIVDTDNDTLVTEDIFIWSLFNFVYQKSADGNYEFLRNLTDDNGNPYSYNYILELESSDLISGVIARFFPDISCTDESLFVLSLVEEGVTCIVGNENRSNLRSGPGTTFELAGRLEGSAVGVVVGQAMGDDNITWWKLSDDTWVRSDVVSEEGDCENVPTVEA